MDLNYHHLPSFTSYLPSYPYKCTINYHHLPAILWLHLRLPGFCSEHRQDLEGVHIAANPKNTREVVRNENGVNFKSFPIGSMYGIYANIGGILMVIVTIYSIHGSYGNRIQCQSQTCHRLNIPMPKTNWFHWSWLWFCLVCRICHGYVMDINVGISYISHFDPFWD